MDEEIDTLAQRIERMVALARQLTEENQRLRALLEASRLVDERMRDIRDAGKVKGVDRIAVMAALQIANEMLGAGGSDGGRTTAKAAARIKRISEELEAELLRQESLF